MGKIGIIERLPIKKQLIYTFILIMVMSVIMTLITLGIGLSWLIKTSWFNPANHYEQQIPAIQRYVRSMGEEILDPQQRAALENKIPLDGMQYQVLDIGGKVRYGTLEGQIIADKISLIDRMNTSYSHHSSLGFGGVITKIIPVATLGGDLRGALILEYKMEVSTNGKGPNSDVLKFALILFFVASPFIFIALFTYIFAARFGRQINRPVKELIEASKRIQRQDLDFSITYRASNEIGLLTESFDNMRKALKDSLLREWKMEQERRDMMDALAHDFRTPMTIIQGNVELLLDTVDIPRDKLEGQLKVVEHNIKRVNRLIQDIQVASEKDLEYFPLHLKEIDIHEFSEMKEREIRYLCSTNQLKCTYLVEDRRQAAQTVYMDVQRVGQILDNIVTNSIRFAPDQGELSVTVTIHDQYIRYEICDSGPGFKDTEIPHLFQKFYRGEQGQSGLGLYTARVITEKHGGTIHANNRQDGGACVIFTIKTERV